MRTAFVKPATPGLKVPYQPLPKQPRRWLPAGGAVVPLSTWWQRRIAAGEVIVEEGA